MEVPTRVNETSRATGAARGARIMHAALAIGLLLVGATFFLVRQVQPLDSMPGVGLAVAGIALAVLAGCFAFLRGRVPQRHTDQSPDDYWAANENRGPAVVLWAGVDSAGVLAWMGYMIGGGQVAPAAVAVLAIIGMMLVRPARLEG